MRNIVITESQLRVITEALGVPDNILDAADMLYDVVEQDIKTIDTIQDEYNFDGEINFELGNKKKIKIDSYTLTVKIEEIEDEKEGVLDIISMGMEGGFGFNRDVYMKETEPSTTLELSITFAVGENWEPEGLIQKMEEERDEHVSSLSHEIKHKYDKQSKQFGLMGLDAEYQATQKRGTFGIPAIDSVFYRFMYYIHAIENLVRPTEVAYSMKRKNITKSQFKEFLENNRVYKELLEIKNFSFDDFISQLKEQEERLDAILEHINDDPSNMTIDEKIKRVLEVVHIDLVNNKMDLFVEMTSHSSDDFLRMALDIGLLPPNAEKNIEGLKKTNEIRQKFFNYVIKYQENPTKFFENEFKNFNFVANKMLKKISKLYAMAKDDEQVSESIINWELHQQIMEKKYGKRKIETKYKNWNLK
jgi:predicted CopG family antitoxin